MKIFNRQSIFTFSLIFAMLACSLPRATAVPPTAAPTSMPATEIPPATPTTEFTATPLPPTPTLIPPTPTKIPHSLVPSTDVELGKKLVVDAVSVETAAELRAPYGDLYKYNWFERPFTQDMTYVADLDIASYNLSYDDKFFYVSIALVGTNPNNPIGINYGVELDLNADGFGEYIVIAHPPYDVDWSADTVQVVEDTNSDTGGLSAEVSDAPLPGDGYDTVIFDGGRGADEDPDLAWVRVNAGRQATVQFAFKRTLAGDKFLYGVVADGGIKDIGKMDYVDRFTEEQAGSPEKSEKYYPLGSVYAVDNVCREVFGFKGNRDVPQRCRPK
jgi:hypothetical protein